MASVNQQAAQIVATQVAAMSEFSALWHGSGTTIQVRRFDWDDIFTIGGVTVRYDDTFIESEGLGTNNRDAIGYPVFLCVVNNERMVLTEELELVQTFLQAVRRKYNNRRRMSTVSDTGTAQLASRATFGPRAPKSGRGSGQDIRMVRITLWFLEPREAA